MNAKFVKALNEITTMDELNSAFELMKLKQKSLLTEVRAKAKSSFSVGDLVVITSSKCPRELRNVPGKLTKINRTTVKIDFDSTEWKVPLTMIKKAS